MIHRRDGPEILDYPAEKQKEIEPPMNTDEHRLKADREKR